MKNEIRQITYTDTWNIRHRVMWPNQPFDYIKLPEDAIGNHFGLFKNEKIVAVVSLFINDGEAQFRKLATEIQEQGQGYGTLLLSYLIDFTSKQKVKKIWCNARADKTSFYTKFGMVPTNKKYTKGGIEFVVMEKKMT
ncbi:MAG: GNAT family N-acetyltransferase [Flavobacteriaceae bacterium]|nr:MAG: GNAT family N-acetyltransferase [Flavobacteriaceae bacterium]